MDSPDAIIIGVGLLVACVVAVLIKVQVSKVGTPLENWARRQGLKIISEERTMHLSARILGEADSSPQVVRIVVRDREGRTRSGQVQVGRPLDKIVVRWDD
jgi:hypothetical protein